jgi:hypothetical protein
MNLKISYDKAKYRKGPLDLKNFIQVAQEECLIQRDRLDRNIQKGLDVTGKKLKKYSAAYKKAIENEEVTGGTGGLGVRKVSTRTNLTISGDLLGSRQVVKTKDGAMCIFQGGHYSGLTNADLAESLHKRGFKGWHEFSKKDLKRVDAAMGRKADEAIKKSIEIKKDT